MAFTQATPHNASGWVVTATGRRNPCRTSVCELPLADASRDRLPAANSEDSRAREARLDLYQGHLTYEESGSELEHGGIEFQKKKASTVAAVRGFGTTALQG